jgi:hypothetical protein
MNCATIKTGKREDEMNIVHSFLLGVLVVIMVGCSSGLQVLQKPNANDRLAIVLFEDCTSAIDCPGSGKKISDIYGEVLGAPIVMFESDAKNYDILLTGKITNYNEAVVMAGNANVVTVDLILKRISDNTVLIKQVKQTTGTNLFSSTKGLTQDLAESLKTSMK